MIPYRLAAAVTLAGLLLAGLWWHFRPHPAPVLTPVIAQPSKVVSSVGTETIKTPLKVFKPESKSRLNLPKSIQQDPAEFVAAASTVKADDHPHTVSTVVNEKTGDVTTYDTREPLPWVAVDTHGEAGIGYGLKYSPIGGFRNQARIVVRQNLLDIKAAKISVQATLDQDKEAFGGVFITGTW